MLDWELERINEQIDLEEARKEICLISDRTEDFKRVAATILNKDYFAHKTKYFGWNITDRASGLSIKTHLPTLMAAKDYLKTMPEEDLEIINKIKSTEKYKEQCRKLAAANVDDYELYEDYCCSVFEALDEDEQISLFEYNISVINKLDTLIESIDTNIRYEDIISGKRPIDQQIIDISIELTKKFHIINPDKWPYQLQLMCNAYITEKGVLDILNDRTKVSNLNKKLESWYIANQINTKYIKYFSNIGYKFNGNPDEYEILSTAANSYKYKNKVDLITISPQDAMFNNVEVKATKFNTNKAKDFHNAEAVFIYRIDENLLYLKIRCGKNLVLTDITYPIKFNCICIKPTAGKVIPWQKEYDTDEF